MIFDKADLEGAKLVNTVITGKHSCARGLGLPFTCAAGWAGLSWRGAQLEHVVVTGGCMAAALCMRVCVVLARPTCSRAQALPVTPGTLLLTEHLCNAPGTPPQARPLRAPTSRTPTLRMR